ncbi:hypothetical protein [Flavobacterium sp. J27]|uniref:hypothetical protein n=1 Tax=Flavobacterium sp. J27 TaxID=2060419 RepID=UPI00102F7AC9|nr:hypothetical protein [Flavobacterium sp. J27]
MKFLLNILFILLFISCSTSSKSIKEKYVLDKSENNAYNVILHLDSKNNYRINTISSGASGETVGKWILEKNTLILMPNIEEKSIEDFNGELVEVVKFKPFSDTIKFKVRNNKLTRIDKKNLILYAQ